MGNGSKRGVDAADRLIEKSPIKVMWVMSRAMIICPWIIGQKDAELSYLGSYTLITYKKTSTCDMDRLGYASSGWRDVCS